MRSHLPFVLACVSAIAGSELHAQIGTEEEVMQTARGNQFQPYIAELVNTLALKLEAIVKENPLKSSKDKLSWLLTANKFIGTIRYQAPEVSKIVSDQWFLSIYEYLYTARSIEDVRIQGFDLALATAKMAVTKAKLARCTEEEVKRIGFDVAEWTLLNYYLAHIEELTREFFFQSLEECDHPSNTLEDWLLFREQGFPNLSQKEILFFTPWFATLDSLPHESEAI